MRSNLKPLLAAAVAASAFVASAPAHAGLVLTAQGIADGFSLSTFYSSPVHDGNYDVLSLANLSDGTLVGAGWATNQLYKFSDVDGQGPGTQLSTVNFGAYPLSARAGGQTYVGALSGGYYRVDSGLNLTPVVLSQPVQASYGLWGNQLNGHLIAGTFDRGLIDIDPTAGTWVQIGPLGTDGVTISPDGTIAYAEVGGCIRGYSVTTPNPGTPVFSSCPGHSPDGTGVISGGTFNGDIIVNNNDGTIGLMNHLTGVETIIATGGSRGDLVSPDLSNGTLFLSFYDEVYRLSCGPGCAIGSAVPEPASLGLLALGLLGLGWSRREKA